MTRGEHLAQAAQVEQVEQVEQAEQVEQGEQVEQAGPGRPSPSNVGTAPSNVGSAGIGGEHDGQSHSNIVIPNAPPSNHVLARTGDRPVNGLGDLGFQGFPVYDAGHGNMNSYGGRQLGAPLGVFVPLTLREKIWRSDFVQLGALLGVDDSYNDEVSMSFVQIGGQVCLKPIQPKVQPIFDVDSWTSAFFVFMSIYLERYPDRSIELIKYVDLIRKLATRFGGQGWMNYDREFRLMQARSPARSWASYDPDLFLEKLAMPVYVGQQDAIEGNSIPATKQPISPGIDPFQTSNQNVLQGRNPFRPTNQHIMSANGQPIGICYAYNGEGGCTWSNCKFEHRCRSCLKGGHGLTTCWAAGASKGGIVGKKGAVPNQGGNNQRKLQQTGQRSAPFTRTNPY